MRCFLSECEPEDGPDVMVPPLTRTRARINEWTAASCGGLEASSAVPHRGRRGLIFNEFEVMASIDLLKERFCSYDKMYSQERREQSFVDWPFREDCKCTPERVKQLHLCSKRTT